MVLEVVVATLLGVVRGLLGVIPDMVLTLPTTGGGFVVGYATLNTALPLGEMVVWFGLMLGWQLMALPWLTAIYVYRLVPGKFT